MENSTRKVILKLSGEALAGEEGRGVSPLVLGSIARQVAAAFERGVRIGIVVGGGNFWRGALAYRELPIERITADQIGMLATVMNGLVLRDAIENVGVPARIFSPFQVGEMLETYNIKKVRAAMNSSVVVLSGGIGSPYFTTDTTAALRAVELGATEILKATKVDGIYDKDPALYPDAVLFKEITYLEVLSRKIKVMDSTAVALCMENGITIRVFNMFSTDSIFQALMGNEVGSVVVPGEASMGKFSPS